MRAVKLFLLKSYLRLGLFFYFRRVHISGIRNIPLDKPTLILANHRNALIDALLIAVNLPRYGYFLTRASVFKKPLISKFLTGVNMIPVYRIRDGWSTLTQNTSIFVRCIELLDQKNIVVIFPEGSHNLVRRVRPLSKGFTRIVFDFFEKHPDQTLQLVPVGLNFSLTTGFVDEASVIIGKPIEISNNLELDRPEKVKALRSEMRSALSALTVQIPKEDYDTIISKLDRLSADYLKPDLVNKCIDDGLLNCPEKNRKSLRIVRKLSKFILIIIYFLPYLVWKRLIQPKITEMEFMATFRYAAVVILAPIYLLLIFFSLAIFTSWLSALMVLLLILLITTIAVKL